MNSLSRLASKIVIKYKLANDEPSPDTVREPAPTFETAEPVQQDKPTKEVMEFMDMLHSMAGLKNILVQMKDRLPTSVGLVIRELISLRPGVIRNALKDSITTGSYSAADFVSLRDDVSVSIQSSGLGNQLQQLFQMVKQAADTGQITHVESQAVLPRIRNIILSIVSLQS